MPDGQDTRTLGRHHLARGHPGVLIRSAALAAVIALTLPVAPAARAQPKGRVVTDTLWAGALGTRKELRVYLPPSYDAQPQRRYPVVYYLHGWTGNERNWVEVGRLDSIADSVMRAGVPEMIIAMPDGDDSWYTTWNTLENAAACRRDTVRTEPASSYCVSWPHYDDYIVNNVVSHVDRKYRTKADREHRGIAGLSMGGYGAVTLAMNNPNVFAAAASHSGVLAPELPATDSSGRIREGAERVAALREYYRGTWASLALAFGRDSTAWRARDPSRIASRVFRTKPHRPALHIDVGVADRYLPQNRAFHAELTRLGVSHVYRELPGTHNWVYWRANLPASLAWLGTVVGK